MDMSVVLQKDSSLRCFCQNLYQTKQEVIQQQQQMKKGSLQCQVYYYICQTNLFGQI